MSQRDYAWLWLGASKTIIGGGGGITGSGGNVLLKTPPHKLDGPEHLTADDTTTLDSTTTQHGLLPKLSGTATDVLRGDGTFGEPVGIGMVPTFIASTETFTVPVGRQALYAAPIDIEGFLVLDGLLIEVD